MGVIDMGISQVLGWLGKTRTRSQLRDLLMTLRIRANIETARTELRLGNVARCEALLAATRRYA
jgi:hypothetical protein